MATVACTTGTFRSEAGIFIWITRDEMQDPAAMIETLRALYPEMEAKLLAYRESFLATEQIERITV